MGPVVVALDVAADSSAGLVEGFVFVEPYLSFFELAEPGFDEGLGFGVAVAAAAVFDLALGEVLTEAPGGELRAVVGAERELVRPDPMRDGGPLEERYRFLGAAA